MMKILFWILAYSWATLVYSQDLDNVCLEGFYEYILDDQRSSKYEFEVFDSQLCDRFRIKSGNWYRFWNSVGGHIPEANETNCVPVQRCLTNFPIWLDGTHPTVINETVTRRACANYGYDGINNADRCCGWNENIMIKLCPAEDEGSNYYVYQLEPPEACYVAYCGGTEVPKCERDQVFENDTCVAKCPIQQGDPLLSNPTQLPREDGNTIKTPYEFEFSCTVQYPNPVTTMEHFEVTWRFNRQEDPGIEKTFLTANTGLVAKIRGSEILQRGHMGKTIQCKVRSYRNSYREINMCTAKFSREHPMEIFPAYKRGRTIRRVFPPISVSIGNRISSSDIYFVATVPPACPDAKDRCGFGPITVLGTTDQVCSINIYAAQWDSNKNQAISKVPFKVQTKQNHCKGKSEAHSFVLNFETVISVVDGVRVTYNIADLQFHYGAMFFGMCGEWNEPRIQTFDDYQYDTQKIGQFTFVESSDMQYEVQVRMFTCLSTLQVGSCVCAIAIREGDSILGIDHCNRNHRVPLQIQYSPDLEDGAGIFRSNSGSYKICMPSGTCNSVWIDPSDGRTLLAFINASPDYYGRMTGLCGNFDNNEGNDRSITANVESFRIPPGESFFEGHLKLSRRRRNIRRTDFRLCTCKTTNDDNTPALIECGLDDKYECPPAGEPIQQLRMVPLGSDGRRRKREVSAEYSDYTITLEDLAYEFNFGENITGDTSHLTFPTASGMTRKVAEETCKRDVESAVNFEECLEIVGKDQYDGLVENCVDDIRITDSVSIATSLWAVLQENCLGLLKKGIDSTGKDLLTNRSSNSLAIPDPEAVVRKMEMSICPGRCNLNGNCTNGICSCNPGFTGSDCSIEKGVAPKVTGIQNNGICDVEMRPCHRVSMYSDDGRFTEVDNLTCRVVMAVVSLSNLDEPTRAQMFLTNATYTTKWEISCALPISDVYNNRSSVSGFWVSLSFDDVLSNEKFVTIYDSICMDCTDSLDSCTRKENTCMIDGKCFYGGETKEDDPSLECKPEVSVDNWTKIIAWSEWSDYGTCTKPCDYGVQKSTRECIHFTCKGENEQTRMCHSFSCPEIIEQREEGVEIAIQGSVNNIPTIEEKLIPETSRAINEFCKNHSQKCCAQFVDTNTIKGTPDVLANLELISVASGFPKEVSPGQVVFKMLSQAEMDQAIAQCSGFNNTKDKRDATKELVYLDQDVLLMALQEKRDGISKNIGFEVTDVRKSGGELDSFDDSSNKFLWMMVAIVGGCLLVLAAIGLMTYFCGRRKEDHTEKE